ncbi:MAG: Glycosyl transferase group 1 [Candidatus Roizmanbacteria bacterium GW2011_GWA2_35_8]|uniref:Glycosyl transferase group 1 n=1 Tax=Candidatus Roizmanbacteria bacterium GW2011_GWA2_35_8 TaxID=1618479 RepID=A0A0G0G1V3_9BACT|nr:MAG: Glycosyl transferase group 1 [Candidatus Roizmanbacteria bacterium GW2011_GWA2_35_8]
MVIGVDGNEANVVKRAGVSVYALNLLKYFKRQSSSRLSFKIFLRSAPLSDLPKTDKYFSYEIVKAKFLWSQIFLPFRLYRKKDIDVFYSPAHYLPRFCPVPQVVTIHDLAYLFFPQDFLKKDLYQLKFWTKYSIDSAKRIIAVSKTTKKDLMNSYHIPSSKIKVIYNGYEKKHLLSESKLKTDLTKNPYILYVGTLQPRKNITTLIKAFSRLKLLYPETKLVIAGKKGWLYDKIYRSVDKLGMEDDVYFADFVTDNQLVFLYKNAFCFVIPSLYEGFGIPTLEAMSFSCPVISSFSSSLPEIAGNAALYFDPNNHYDLVEKIKTLKENPILREKLIKNGKERIKKFSWDTCAKETLEVIISTIS